MAKSEERMGRPTVRYSPFAIRRYDTMNERRDHGDCETTIVTAAMHLKATPERVFRFHADVRNLPRLTPGPMRVLSADVPTREGGVQLLRLGVPPLTVRWDARIAAYEPPARVVDVQERGPFKSWRHTHLVMAAAGGSILVDAVEFRLLPGRWGRRLDRLVVAPALRLLFVERHRRMRRLLGQRRVRR